ncbi:MAG: S-layer homology domain-containing protein [Cyanobacteria bacterium P01_F01_bin.86]
MTVEFSDIQGHWAEDCIKQLAEHNIVQGYLDGSFKPDKTLTRAEFSAMLQVAFAEAETIREHIIFNDLLEDHWAAVAIQFAYQTGFLSGYPEQLFKPDISMPRVQAMVSLASGLSYEVPTEPEAVLTQFDDASEIPDYAVEAIAAVAHAGLELTDPETQEIKPNDLITRGQLAALLCQTLPEEVTMAEDINPPAPENAESAQSEGESTPEVIAMSAPEEDGTILQEDEVSDPEGLSEAIDQESAPLPEDIDS